MSVRPGEPLSGRLDYDALGARLPDGVEPADDGMVAEARGANSTPPKPYSGALHGIGKRTFRWENDR